MINKDFDDNCEINCIHEDEVEKAKRNRLPEEVIYQMAETFKALGDPTRLKIINALNQGELCVCDLAAVVEVSQSAISHQLRLLRNLRLVKFRKEGKVAYYSLDDFHVLDLFRCCLEHVNHSE
ncbi:MAG TPA: helix-turn-helix transcriptional regulator [Clostridia bacterium]|jgi:ArsR family transcriptional regulator|nr:helix-turn-helix transcriptional regulator [Clostridia bacterium]